MAGTFSSATLAGLALAMASSSLLLGQSAPPQDPLRQALELYRAGNCKAAEPILQNLLKQQPKNASLRKLLASCQAQDAVATTTAKAPVAPTPKRSEVAATTPVRPAPVPAPAPAPAPVQTATVAPAVPVHTGPVTPEDRERIRAGDDLERAEILIQQGSLPEASVILQALRKRLPDLVLPRLRLAEIDTSTKQFSEAGLLYGQIAAKRPDSPEYLLRAAQNYSWDQDYPSAVTYYRKYLAERPEDLQAKLSLADVLLWSRRLDESEEVYRSYLERHTADGVARFHLGQNLLWQEKYDAALRQLKLAADHYTDPDLDMAFAQCYEQLQQPERAIAFYAKVLKARPQDETASAAHDRLTDDLPRMQGFARLEKNDYEGAAPLFVQYLGKHPTDASITLEVARVYYWDKQYSESARYYSRYLAKMPRDRAALREAGRVELAIPDYKDARTHYEQLAGFADPSVEDYEGLLHALVWDDQWNLASPYARKLLAIDARNAVASDVLRQAADRGKADELEQARTLTAASQYTEAIASYQDYVSKYGSNQEIALTMPRLHSWNKDYAGAVVGYKDYLRAYPDDVTAQTELAENEKWAGALSSAAKDYQAVLKRNAADPQALLGLAQIAEQSGQDSFVVNRAYQRVLASDSGNQVAQDRVEALAPAVSPSIAYNGSTFSDSDGLGRSLNELEAAFPVHAGIKLAPFMNYDYFDQLRQIGGAQCGSASTETDPRLIALSNQICADQGTARGVGGGLRFELAPSSLISINGSVGETTFDHARSDLQARGEILLHAGGNRLVSLSVLHRNGAYDLNIIGPLFAGIIGDSALLSYQQPLGDKWLLWLAVGAARYSGGTGDIAPVNTQKIASARADYRISPEFRAGYYMRISSFTEPTVFYFSPSFYGTYGLSYEWDKHVANNLRFTLDGEVGYGRIDRYATAGLGTVEVSLNPSFSWRVGSHTELAFGYRYGRGQTSAFGASPYTTNALTFGIRNFFTPQLDRSDPARLNIH